MLWFKSESRGMLIWPKPPSLRGVFIHAKCVKCESTEQATTSVLILRNSSIRSLNARISVGHTKVLQKKFIYGATMEKFQFLTNPAGRRKTPSISLDNLWILVG